MKMKASNPAAALLMASLVLVGVSLPGHAAPGDSMLVLVSRDHALSDPSLESYPAYEISAERMLILMPERMAAQMQIPERQRTTLDRFPLWVTPAPIPEDVALRVGAEVVLREGVNTIFRASRDAAYQVLAQGFSVVEIEFQPLRRLESKPWRSRMAEAVLEERPLDAARMSFLSGLSDSVDTLRLKQTLHFLEYDDANHRFRSRFQARPEVRQEIVPYLTDRLAYELSPYGGGVTGQQFVQRLGGAFACTGTIPCDTVFVNVIGDKPGTKTTAHYIICAHYDAIATHTPGWSDQWYMEGVPAPGADDNGTGIAALLECARLIGPLELDVGVKFVGFAGEEPGLLGSKYYAGHLSPEDSVIGVINFDMVGYVNETPLIEIVYDWRSLWLADQLEEVAATLDLGSETELVNMSGIANSDHASFWTMGIPGSMLIEELRTIGTGKGSPVNPYYHSIGDTSGNLRMDILGDAVRMVVGLIARYAETPEDSFIDVSLTEASVEWDWGGRDLSEPPLVGDSLSVRVRAVNLGKAMEVPEPYVFEIWRGSRETGILINRSTVDLELSQGEPTDLEYSWTTVSQGYGDILFTFVLLPVREDAEVDTTNNTVEVVLSILPTTAMLRSPHVTPNPAGSAGEGCDSLRFEILHPEGDFYAVMDIWVFDILGQTVGRGMLERSPTVRDFGPGKNSIELSRFVSGRLAPGLYVCKSRLRFLGEPGVFEETFKFAVDR